MTATKFSPRLKAAAQVSGIEYIDALRLCFAEEFIRRLHQSVYAQRLVLRGGFLVRVLTDSFGKDRDVDFLYLDAPSDISASEIYEMANDIVSVGEDHMPIAITVGAVQELDPKKCYTGYSVSLLCELETARLTLKINIGLNDKLFHETEELELPTLIVEQGEIHCLCYPVESIIAEKLDILLCRFELNRCMQHLYDIYILSCNFDFDGYELQRAVKTTLDTRNNDCAEGRLQQLATLKDDEDIMLAWQHYARIFQITETLETVLGRTISFVGPIWDHIHNEKRWQREWSAVEGRWTEPMYLY